MMARTVRIQEDPPSSEEDDSSYNDSRTSRVPRTAASAAAANNASSSSLTSPSSDKENADAVSSNAKKSKGASSNNNSSARSKGKGKEVDRGSSRLAEIDASQNEILDGDSDQDDEGEGEEDGEGDEEEGEEEEEEEGDEEEEAEPEDTEMYDPDQDPEERRQVRMQYRELLKKLNDNKNEYLQPNNDGILRTFQEAEELFKKVKQTSDATIDSRILVQATDLTLKKATSLTYGNAGAMIDADEFVGQCITFMRSNTGPRRPPNGDDLDNDDGAADDAMDWAYLGRMAAFKGNKRPATTDFLLGPLSVTKKIRVVKARRQGLRRDKANLVRPVEVTQDPNDKSEAGAGAMSALVQRIYLGLRDTFRRNPEYEKKGLNLFKFVVNPDSFGQTIENIFYLSFLVKDGFIAITYDEDTGLPVIHCTDPPTQEDHQQLEITRNQVIFSMTMWEWQQMKHIFNITESMIPMREQEQALTSATSWYS